MDGPEWKDTRKKMNPLFLKESFYRKFALPWSNKITDLLIADWLQELQKVSNGDRSGGGSFQVSHLEGRLHKWSVESILASLFGEAFFNLGNVMKFYVSTAISSLQVYIRIRYL